MSQTTPIKAVIAVLSASNFVIGMGGFIVISIIDPLAAGLDVSLPAAGMLMTVYAIAYAILSPVLVALTGRFGRRRVMFYGLLLFAVASLLSALMPTIGPLYVVRMAAAAGAGMMTPVSIAVVAGLAAPERRGKALAAVFFGLSLAQVLGVPAGSWVAYTFGWRMAFVIVFVLALPCLWLIWTRVPQGLSFQPTSLRDLGRMLVDPLKLGTALFTASFLAAIYIVLTYLPPLLSQQMGYGRDGVSLVLLVFGMAAVAGNALGGWMADRLGPMRTLTILCLGQIVLMPGFSALPFGDGLLLALVFVWSVWGWSFTAAQQMRVISLAPEQAAVMVALNAASIYIGIAAGSAIGGVVLERAGLPALGIAGGVGAVWALVHLVWSHRAAARRAQRGL